MSKCRIIPKSLFYSQDYNPQKIIKHSFTFENKVYYEISLYWRSNVTISRQLLLKSVWCCSFISAQFLEIFIDYQTDNKLFLKFFPIPLAGIQSSLRKFCEIHFMNSMNKYIKKCCWRRSRWGQLKKICENFRPFSPEK